MYKQRLLGLRKIEQQGRNSFLLVTRNETRACSGKGAATVYLKRRYIATRSVNTKLALSLEMVTSLHATVATELLTHASARYAQQGQQAGRVS